MVSRNVYKTYPESLTPKGTFQSPKFPQAGCWGTASMSGNELTCSNKTHEEKHDKVSYLGLQWSHCSQDKTCG